MPTTSASDALCRLMAVIRCALYNDPAIAPLPEGMTHLAHLSLRQLCKLLWVMSGVLHRRAGGRSLPKARSHYLSELERLAEGLEDWPNGFQQLLCALYEAEIAQAIELPRFHAIFGWIVYRLIKHDEDDGGCYTFLEQEVYRFGAKFWTRSQMRREGGRASFPAKLRWGTISEAADVLGLHMATMKKLIDAGEIRTRSVSIKKKRNLLVDLEWVRSQKMSKQPAINFRNAAKQIGVSIETLKAMRVSGLLTLNYRLTFPKSIAQEDLDALMARFHVIAKGKRPKHGANIVTIEQAFLRFGATPAQKAEFFRRLLDEPALVIGRLKASRRTEHLQMELAAAQALFNALCLADEGVTTQAAKAHLQCTAAVVTALVRSGHLQCTSRRGRRSPRRDSVEAFAACYAPMASIATGLYLSSKRLYARVDFSKLRHVKVETPQYTTVFLDRSDVAKLKRQLEV